MDSTSQRYGFDVEIVIISMSNPYGNDIAMALSYRYRFDIATIWIRHRNDMDSMSNPYGNDNVVTMSQRNDFDIESISSRRRIHIETITSLRYRNDIDTMSMPVSNPYRNNLVSM